MMSQIRRKTKPKDVSAPIKVEHVSHVGLEDVNVENGAVTANPPAPCGGTDLQAATQTIVSNFLSEDFRQTLRKLIREEITNAFDDERPKLLSEIEKLQYVPISEPVIDDIPKQQLNILATERLGGSKDACWELVDADPIVEDGSSTNTVIQTMRQFSDPLPVPAPRPNINKDIQASYPGDSTSKPRVYHSKKPASKPRATRRVSKDDERECLAQALQANIIPLVDRLQFNYSEIPERLIGAGHMTEDECRMIRDELSRKDQVRYLVSRVKSRDLSDMKRFLEILEKEAPDIVASIDKTFKDNRKNNVKCKTCALCMCSSNVDIKDVGDMLWSSMVIPDGFYNEIIACTKPLGSQKHLWKTMIDILKGKHDKKNAYESLFSSILSRGNFDFIVKPLRVMLEKEGRLDCHCHSSLRMTSFELSIGSTSSHSPMTTPGSRLSAPSETEYTDDNLDATYRKRVARFERNSFIEGKHGENMEYQPASLDSVLDSILDSSAKPDTNTHIYANQTVEFHRPIQDGENLKENLPKQSDYLAGSAMRF